MPHETEEDSDKIHNRREIFCFYHISQTTLWHDRLAPKNGKSDGFFCHLVAGRCSSNSVFTLVGKPGEPSELLDFALEEYAH